MRFFSVLFALGCLAPASASALSCVSGPYFSVPAADSVDVPTNVKLALWYADQNPDDVPVRLIESGTDEEMDLTIVPIGDSGGGYSFIPETSLKPGTSYSLEISYGNDTYSKYIEFETGETADELAPASPNLLSIETGQQDTEWGNTDWVRTDVGESAEEVYYRVEVADNASFANSETSTVYYYGERVSVGKGLCERTLTMDATDVQFVRMTAIDRAGNESVVSEIGEPMGCSSIGAAKMAGWMSLAMLPVLLGRFRRR